MVQPPSRFGSFVQTEESNLAKHGGGGTDKRECSNAFLCALEKNAHSLCWRRYYHECRGFNVQDSPWSLLALLEQRKPELDWSCQSGTMEPFVHSPEPFACIHVANFHCCENSIWNMILKWVLVFPASVGLLAPIGLKTKWILLDPRIRLVAWASGSDSIHLCGEASFIRPLTTLWLILEQSWKWGSREGEESEWECLEQFAWFSHALGVSFNAKKRLYLLYLVVDFFFSFLCPEGKTIFFTLLNSPQEGPLKPRDHIEAWVSWMGLSPTQDKNFWAWFCSFFGVNWRWKAFLLSWTWIIWCAFLVAYGHY